MDLRLERLTLERAQTAEWLELVCTVDRNERPYTFAKKRAEMELRHRQEMAKLEPIPKEKDPRNVPRDPAFVEEVFRLICENPGIARQTIVEKLSEPRTNMGLTNVLSTLRRRGWITNLGTRKRPQWHPITD
jgi:hypothetical protein